MAVDVFGDTYVDYREYARKIITKGAKDPFYKVDSHLIGKHNVTMIFLTEDDKFVASPSTFNVIGVYAIFEKLANGKYSTLYAGCGYVHDRIYRFVKELHDASRPDESHSGARKARRDGVNPKNIYVKVMAMADFPKVDNLRIDMKFLDEAVAPLLKSRYNVRTRY